MSIEKHFDFRRGIVGLLATQDHSSKDLLPIATDKPVDCRTKNVLDEVISNPLVLDELILQRLRPVIRDKAILAPSCYERLLLSTIDALNKMSHRSGEAAYSYCSDMLKYELRMVEYINTQKRASKWM
jgi:hypothetical protein